MWFWRIEGTSNREKQIIDGNSVIFDYLYLHIVADFHIR